jgi:hypothetical protein
MSRKLVLVTALLFALLPLGASASAGDITGPVVSAGYLNKPSRVTQINVGTLSKGKLIVRMYLTTLDRYMRLQPGTTKSAVLKKAYVFTFDGKTVKIPAGTKYWTFYGTNGWWRKGVYIVVKVRSGVPLTDASGKPHQLCVKLDVRATGPGALGYQKFPMCLPTRQWITSL